MTDVTSGGQTEQKFELRPFQKRVFNHVMAGNSVILQAPTGAGKTRAALAPFLQNIAASVVGGGDALPLTCRYAVPLRVLATQFFQEYQFFAQRLDAMQDARLHETYKVFEQQPVQIQTGEQPDDPQFESMLTFCTIDQLLASALGVPYSIGGRRANMNVGAVFASYLVFDEFHLFPLQPNGYGARTTVLELLRMARLKTHRPLVPFVMMTATFSSTLLERLATMLGATVEKIEDADELAALNAGRTRIFHVHPHPMDARTILERHTSSSLVVCNTVRRSQQMYLELRELVYRAGKQTRVLLLHSRFADEDRRWLQQELETSLGKDSWEQAQERDLIVVATQVVEVGLDISAECLHSEIAPANNIIQRAGRCARFPGLHGEVYLYPLAEDESYRPYAQSLCEATLAAFAAYDGQHVGFAEEQKVIDVVHSDEDKDLLDRYERERSNIRRDITRALSTNKRENATELIRNVQQLPILVHDDPNTAITERPWQFQSFGIHPGTLAGVWDVLDEQWAQHGEDGAFCFKPYPLEQEAEAGERMQVSYQWEKVTSPEALWKGTDDEVRKARHETEKTLRGALMVVLPPLLATYDQPQVDAQIPTAETWQRGIGFVLNDGKLDGLYSWPATPYRSGIRPEYQDGARTRTTGSYGYEQESYVEHVRGLLHAYLYSRLRQELGYPSRVWEEALHVPAGAIDQTIRLMFACHDIGKLDHDWQRWCELWQGLLVERYPTMSWKYQIRAEKQPFAHSDHDGSKEHTRLQKDVYRRYKLSRPHHACESAAACWEFFAECLGVEEPEEGAALLSRAAVAAIARHHAPQSQEYTPMRLCAGAEAAIEAGIEVVRQGQQWSYDTTLIEREIRSEDKLADDQMTLPNERNSKETLLYYLLVRVLRLADTRSFRYKE